MGTPHRGSDIAAALNPLATVLDLGLRASGGGRIIGSIRKDLIRLLSRDSNALGDITESFVHRVEKLKIISFYETEIPPGLSQMVRYWLAVICCS
jgi:ankyrin repeat domain-containing protein 50